LEYPLINGGIMPSAAHQQALDALGHVEVDLYHPDVILALPSSFSDAWRRYWGLPPLDR
jgi:hypothetical protein